MTARISLIPESARGHRLRLRAIALALRGPRAFPEINEIRAVIDRAYKP